MVNCPACGHENDDWDAVCANCGQALPVRADVPAAPTPPAPPAPPAPEVPYAPAPVAPAAPEVPYAPAPMAPPAPAASGQYAPPPGQYPPPPTGQYPMPPQPQYDPYAGVRTGYAPPMPETYLWQSIVATLLCCWPLGIPAIVFATRVSSLYQQGNYAGAQEASNKARTWTIVAVAAGVLVVVLYVLLVVVAGLGGFMTSGSATGYY